MIATEGHLMPTAHSRETYSPVVKKTLRKLSQKELTLRHSPEVKHILKHRKYKSV